MFVQIFRSLCSVVTSAVMYLSYTSKEKILFRNTSGEYKSVTSRETLATFSMVSFGQICMYFVTASFSMESNILFSLALCNSILVTGVTSFLIIPFCKECGDPRSLLTMFKPLTLAVHNANLLMMVVELINRQEFLLCIKEQIGMGIMYVVIYCVYQLRTGVQFYFFLDVYSIKSVPYVFVICSSTAVIQLILDWITPFLFSMPYIVQYVLILVPSLSITTWS